MSNQARHSVAFELRNEYVAATITCHGTRGEDGCLLKPCAHGCEDYSVERDERGFFHMVEVYDETKDGPAEARHDMTPWPEGQGSCNFIDWIDGEVAESYDGPRTAAIAGDIEFTWDGDSCTWAYATKEARP